MANFFESSTKKEVLQTAGEAAARQKLTDTLASGMPNQPDATVYSPVAQQQKYMDAVDQYADSETEGSDYFRDVVGGSASIMDDPAYQALFDKTKEAGELETNRVGRSLQMRGGTSSGAGQDVLGRTVAQNNSNTLATMAPYQQALDQQKMTAAQSLAQFGESGTINRLSALGQTGDFMQKLDNLNKDAAKAREMTIANWDWNQGAGLAVKQLQNKADWSVTQSPSMFSQIAAPVAEVAAAYFGGKK